MNNMQGKRAPMKKALTYFVLATVLVFAMSYSIYGIVMPDMKADFGITVSQSGLISQFQYIGEFVALILAGFVIERLNKSILISGILFAFSAFLLIMSRCTAFSSVLALFTCMGVCSSLINLSSSSYVAEAYPEDRAGYLNIMHGLFSVGCILGPFIPSLLSRAGGDYHWSNTYNLLAGVNGVYAILFAGIILACVVVGVFRHEKQNKQVAAEGEKGGYLHLLRNGTIVLFVLLLILCNGQQICYSTWMPSLMREKLMTQDMISLTVSLYNIGIAVGRISFPVLSRKLGAKRIIVWGSLAGGAVFLIGVFSGNAPMLMITAPIVGLFSAAIMPAILGYACDSQSENTGGVTTLCCMACSLGAIVTPWLTGRISEQAGLAIGVCLIPASLLVISVAMLSYFNRTKSTGKEVRG